jgi:hypothetical protein
MKLKEKLSRKVKFYRVSYKQSDPESRISWGLFVGLLLIYLTWAIQTF